MSGIKDVVDDMKFEAWLRTCAGMSPVEKRKRLSQIEGSCKKRSADAERVRRCRRDDERAFKNVLRCGDDDEPIMPECGSGLPSTRYFGRRGMTDHE